MDWISRIPNYINLTMLHCVVIPMLTNANDVYG